MNLFNIISPFGGLALFLYGMRLMGDVGLYKDSVVLLEQIRTIDKRRLREHMGHADESVMNQVDSAIAVSFGLTGI